MRRFLTASTLALTLGTAAGADPWSVLVIGGDSDAIALSERLAADGVTDVRHLVDGTARDIADAVRGLAGAERAAIYYNGALVTRGGQPAIGDDPRLTMAALADTLAAGGASQTAILVENCGSFGQGAEVAPPVGTLRADLLLAASAGPGEGCSGPVLTQALAAADLTTPLAQIAGVGWIGVAPRGDFSLDPGPGATSGTVAWLEARAEGTTIAAAPPVAEVQNAAFIMPSAAQIAAIPVSEGMPQPSIIVGVLRVAPEPTGVAAVVGSTAATPLGGGEITFDNLEARAALRAEQPELFATLVGAGALDPPQAELARALQTELARMECYTLGIDGQFGPGSQRAVRAYYEERGDPVPVSQAASVELFRDIILNEDVTCPPPPAPVATSSAPSRSSPSASTSRSQPAAQSRPARQQPAPQQAAPRSNTSSGSSSPRIQQGTTIIGGFR